MLVRMPPLNAKSRSKIDKTSSGKSCSRFIHPAFSLLSFRHIPTSGGPCLKICIQLFWSFSSPGINVNLDLVAFKPQNISMPDRQILLGHVGVKPGRVVVGDTYSNWPSWVSVTVSLRLIKSWARHRFVAASSRSTAEKVASRRGSGRHCRKA